MKKTTIILVVLALAALLITGCQQKSDYATGYSNYGQQGQQQPYVGGGCGVAPVSDAGELPSQVAEPKLAARVKWL